MPFQKGHKGWLHGPMSKKHKHKISKAHKGMKKPWAGKWITEEEKNKRSFRMMGKQIHLGKKHSEETKRKIRNFNLGKKHSIETRLKLSGKNAPNWKGGVTPINHKMRHSLEYKLWRKSVFERDKYTCIWCGLRFVKGKTGKVTLNADHIKSFSQYPELRFAIDNGRTLCKDCHRTTDNYGINLKFIK